MTPSNWSVVPEEKKKELRLKGFASQEEMFSTDIGGRTVLCCASVSPIWDSVEVVVSEGVIYAMPYKRAGQERIYSLPPALAICAESAEDVSMGLRPSMIALNMKDIPSVLESVRAYIKSQVNPSQEGT